MKPTWLKKCLWLGLGLAWAAQTLAQSAFPARALRIVVPTTPGSGSDVTARYFGEQIAAALGVGVVIENRPGGNGIIAAMAVKQAPADGYTLFLGTNTHLAVNPIVVKDLPYDPVKDLKPITGLARGMMIFVGNPQSKIANVADLVKASKAQPQGLSVGTYTAGFHLSAAWFASEASIPFVNVSYKGAPEVFLGLMAGQLEWGVSDLIAAMPQVKAGKLRALAVSGEARHPDYPDIPTLKELGYPNYVNYTWTTLYVRAETPEPATQKLVETLQKIMATQATKDYIRSIGSDPLNLQANEMRQFQRSETERFKRIADGAGIRPQ